MLMDYSTFIHSDPAILGGKPVIKGTRIAVDFVLEQLAAGDTVEDILEGYDHLNREQILACLSYSAALLRNEEVYIIETT